ncbi:MAG: hypothetical protein AB7N54_04500 [Alphaproteobacteria bacterium]
MAGIVAAALVPHAPRLATWDGAPEFGRPLIEGLRSLGDAVRALAPDAILIQSAHWVCTFDWYVTCHTLHEGTCIADEAPDLIPGQRYRRAGDPALGDAIVATLTAAGLRSRANRSEHYTWDYGGVVPLGHMDPDATLPAVELPVVMCADLAESRRAGGLLDAAAKAAGKRVVLLGATALSHALVRTPSDWPTPARMAADAAFLDRMEAGDAAGLADELPSWAKANEAEMGGRVLATVLGALESLGARLSGRRFGPYAQSSGTGNAAILVAPAN